jgi:uncharacterized membrane protein
VLVFLAVVVYAVCSFVRFSHLGAGGFDLGIFDQAVWHYSQFQAPASSIKNLSTLWGDHCSPILITIAPLYWLWSDVHVLLLVQAAVLALAALPIFAYARPRTGEVGAVLLAAAYLVFWGIQAAVGFDSMNWRSRPCLARRRCWRPIDERGGGSSWPSSAYCS